MSDYNIKQCPESFCFLYNYRTMIRIILCLIQIQNKDQNHFMSDTNKEQWSVIFCLWNDNIKQVILFPIIMIKHTCVWWMITKDADQDLFYSRSLGLIWTSAGGKRQTVGEKGIRKCKKSRYIVLYFLFSDNGNQNNQM